MKKLLSIIVLGLLLSGCADPYVVSSNNNGVNTNIKVISKDERGIRIKFDMWCDFKNTCAQESAMDNQIASNHCAVHKKFAYIFPMQTMAGSQKYKCFKGHTESIPYADGKSRRYMWTNYNTSSSIGSSETLPIKTSLSSKKNTCEEIGFSPNTDPFANCILKLMEIEENKINRASQAQIANTQRSIEQEIAKDGRDQEAWKVLLGMMGANGSTTSIGGLLSPSSVSCNKTGETTSGTNKICYYNCMGTTKTINVGSMQFCPININK